MTIRKMIAVLFKIRDEQYLYSPEWLEYNDRINNFKYRF